MPEAQAIPPIDETDQEQTITMDFGDGNYLADGVELTGMPVVTLTVKAGNDPDPASRITAGPYIGLARAPYGSNRPNCAVLFRIANCPGPVSYLAQCKCPTTDGDRATMDLQIDVRVPG